MATDFKHGLEGYRKRRCRCKVCLAANTAYMRRYRARRRGLSEPPPSADENEVSVTVLPAPADVDPEPGLTEQGVIDRCTTGDLVAAAQRMPDLVASCRALARIMDDRRQVPTQPSAHRQLMMGMAKLETAAAFGRRGRLASVAEMSQRGPASSVG